MKQRKQDPIQTKSYVPLTPDGAVKVCTQELNRKQRDTLGALLQIEFLNTIYAGKFQFQAESMPSIEEVREWQA